MTSGREHVPADGKTEPERPGARKPVTIVDVAQRAQVSFKTVSRVINDDPGVSEAMRTRVAEAIADLNFVPNRGARQIRGKRHFGIGLVFDVTKGNYLLEVQQAAMQICREKGYHVVTETLPPEVIASEHDIDRQLHDFNVDGALVLPPLCDDPRVLSALERRGIAYSRMAATSDLDRSPAIAVDDRRAILKLLHHLWALGHRRIGFITGRGDHPSAAGRREAFLQGMLTLSGEESAELIEEGDYSTPSGQRAGGTLLDLADRPTAIMASNDEMAAGVIAAAMMRGLRLPRDLSISGFDDSPTASLVWPPLTTVHQPLHEMTRLGIGQILPSRATHVPPLVRLELELRVRASTAPVAAGQHEASAGP